MPGRKLFKLKKSLSTPNITSEWSKHDEKLLQLVEQAHKEKVESLINKKGLNPTKLSPLGKSAFLEAATRGQKGILEIFLKHGADLYAVDSQGRTALHLAARNGRTEVLLKFIKAGLSVSALDLCQMMPIHHACLGGHLPCVDILISKETPLNPVDKDKRTPLFFAAEMGEAQVCRELLDNSADINAQDFGDRTALMVAAQHGKSEVVDLFVKRGANVRLKDHKGNNAAWYAVQSGHEDIKQIIDEAPMMAAWDVCGPEEPEEEQEKETLLEVKEEVGVSLPDGADRVDFIAQFTVDNSPVTPKRSQDEAAPILGAIVLPGEEEAPSSHESYMEIARNQDSETTSGSGVQESQRITAAYKELVEDNEALTEEYNNMKREMKKIKNKNNELHRRLENRTPPPTSVDTAVVEAFEKEILDLKWKLRCRGDGKKAKQDLDDSWNDSDEEHVFSGSFDKPDARSESVMDRQLVPMLRSQILTLQKENDKLKTKIKKIPNGDVGVSSDEEDAFGMAKLDVNILNGGMAASFTPEDIVTLNTRIQELEKINRGQLKKIRDLEESNNNNGVTYGAEISGVPSSVTVVEALKIEDLQTKNESLVELNKTLKSTADKYKTQNDQLLVDVGQLKSELDTSDQEREAFRKQLHEIANFGNSEEGTDVMKFFHEINDLKRENTDMKTRNDQLEEEIEQLLKQRTVDHNVQGVIPDESLSPQEGVVEEVIFGVQAGTVTSCNESPYESHWTAGVHTQKVNSLEQDNDVLQMRIKELTDQRMELESSAEDMYEEIARNEKQITKLETKNRKLELECDSLRKQCESFEDESKTFKLQISGLKDSVDVVDAQGGEIQKLEEECSKLQDSHEAVSFVLDETKRHVEILAKENEDYKTRIASLEAENVSTCESLRSEAAEEKERLQNHIDILEREKGTYQEQLDELNSKLRKKTNRISNLVQTIEELKRGSSMLSSSKNDIEDQMGSQRREIETLKYENEELEKTIDRLMKRGAEEESIKLSIAKSTSPVPTDDATVAQLEKEIERLKRQVKKLEEDNKEYEEEIQEFAQTNQSNFEQCTQLCEELGTLKEEYDELQDHKVTLEEHYRQSEEERDRLQTRISVKKKEIRELKGQCEELAERNQELTGVVSSLKEQCLQLEVEKDKLAHEIQNIQVSHDETMKVNVSLASVQKSGDGEEGEEEEIHQLREECSDLLQVNSELKVRAQSVTKIQEELFELQEDNDRLTGEIERSAKQVAALSSENQSLKQRCEGLENSVSVSGRQDGSEQEKSELQQMVQNLQDKVVILQHEMNILTKNNAKLTEDCEAHLSATKSLEDERDVVVKERETILKLNQTLRQQSEELERENLDLEKERLKLSDYEQKISNWEGEKNALQTQVNDLKDLETEAVQLRLDFREVKSARLHSDRKAKDFLVQNEELRSEVVKLSQIANSRVPEEQTSEQVKQAVHDAERKIKKLQDEVRRYKKRYQEAEARHRDVVATYRTHLLSAVQGNMNKEVREALDTIQELRK